MKSIVNIRCFVIVVVITLINACAPKEGEPEGEKTSQSITPITITQASIETVSETIELNATSVNKKNIVRSSMSGIIVSVAMNVGDNVVKGQTLFTLQSKEASVLEKNKVNDSSLLFKGAIEIKASKDGSIMSISHQKGDYVQEGDELAQVADPNSLIFLLDVPFELRNYIKIGAYCEIVLPDNRVISGKLASSLPVMDMTSQIVNYVVLPNISEKLPENLIARVQIVKSTKSNAFVLPKNAVLTNETQTEFWVMRLLNDSLAVKVPIKKGIEENKKVEILEPTFSTTDRIVLTGNYGLPDTAKVLIEK